MHNPSVSSTPATAQKTQTSAELTVLKDRLKATWMAGNYDYFSRFMASSATQFYPRIGVPKGAAFLDVACGSGQLAFVAARNGANVTGVDIAENSIKAARGRAETENLSARFDEGDAEALPYADSSFDVVATIYGAMFAPRPELVVQEFCRVCRPGGTMAMANWTKQGFIGQMLGIVSKFVAPPGMPSPLLWGDEETVRARFGSAAKDLRLERVHYRFDYPFSPSEVVDFFRENYGPTTRAFAALAEADQLKLHADLTKLWTSNDESTDPNRTIVSAEYLEVIATRA